MITLDEFFSWAEDYYSVASDGFNAEILWLKYLSGHYTDISGISFDKSEWQSFGHYYFPETFTEPEALFYQDDNFYERVQTWACFSLLSGEELPQLDLSISEDFNTICHKIIWCSKFGEVPLVPVVQQNTPEQLWQGQFSENDDIHAKAVLALRLLGHDLQVRSTIKQKELNPHTYHEILVSFICDYLPKQQ